MDRRAQRHRDLRHYALHARPCRHSHERRIQLLGVLIMTHFNASVANTISHIVDFGGNSTMALACLCARCSPSSSTAPQRRVLASPLRKATASSPA
ncbi:MAG: hypothetical protein ACLTYW_07985 [Collinsella sp.]